MYLTSNARTESAERRLLTLLKDSNDKLYHCYFNVTDDVFLGDISTGIFDYLKSKNYDVISIVNLDTGMFDFLKLYDEEGNELPTPRGSQNSTFSKATNIISYYYR